MYAQEQEKQPPAPEPIPTADIFQETENVAKILDKSADLLLPQEDITRIAEGLPDYFKELDQLNKEMDLKSLERFGSSRLTDLEQSWKLHHEKLSQWQEQLAKQSNLLDSERKKLESLKNVLIITLENAKNEKAPAEVLQRIEQIILRLTSTDKKIKKEFGHVMAVQNRISIKISEIDKTLALVGEKIAEKKAEAFTIDSEPLWKISKGNMDERGLRHRISQTIKAHTEKFNEFYLNFADRVMNHLIIFLLLLGTLFILRNFGNKLIVDKDAAEISREILNHPFSVAVFVSLLLTSQMYPQAPSLISRLAQLASLVPILRLFPILTIPKIKTNLLIFIGLYLLNLIYVLSPEHTLTHRFLLLLISLLSILFFGWIAKNKSIKSLSDEDSIVKYIAYMIRFTIPLMVIAVLANILGNVILASILTVGSLTSIYAAIMLIAASLVIISLLNLLMSTKIAFFSRIIRVHSKLLLEKLSKFIQLIAVLFWIRITLKQFNLFDLFKEWLTGFFSERLQVGTVDISFGDFVVFFLAIYASIIISRFIRFILQEDILVRMRLPRGVPAAVSMLANYSIIGLGFMIALSAAGFDLNRFAILLGALGVGIGFGLQNIVNNFISGLILIFERPIQVGDVVELTNLIGNVKRIGIRSSTIRTFDGSEVIVPNGNLVSNEVTNWTLSDKLRRIQINVGTAYGSNPEHVLKILRNIINNHPEVLEQPEPMILFQEFGDSSLNFNIRFWTATPETWLQLRSEISVDIFRMFKENNIEIPFPQRDLHLKSADPSILNPISDKKGNATSKGIDKGNKSVKSTTLTTRSAKKSAKKRPDTSIENMDGFVSDE